MTQVLFQVEGKASLAPTVRYDALVDQAKLMVDLRNATGKDGKRSDKVWKL